MLTQKDKQFIIRWEAVREQESSTRAKLLNGLPMAVLFSVPILFFIAAIYFFFPDWYTKVSNRLSGSLLTIVIAIIGCTIFFAYFRMHYKWEMNEQLYKELKSKENKSTQEDHHS